MARRDGPTLYEMMSRMPPPGEKADEARGQVSGQGRERPGATPLLTPGRMIRVPVGYIWTAVGLLILMVVLAYVFGYSRGNRRAVADAERISEGLREKLEDGSRVVDPLLRSGGLPAAEALMDDSSAPETPPGGVSRTSGADPRVAGTAYFIAETPLWERADEIVAFIRLQGAGLGLDAAVVPTDNPRFGQVIVLPGFEPSDSVTRDRLRTLIIDLGRRYQRQGKNNDNFDDTYHVTYRGSSN